MFEIVCSLERKPILFTVFSLYECEVLRLVTSLYIFFLVCGGCAVFNNVFFYYYRGSPINYHHLSLRVEIGHVIRNGTLPEMSFR